MGWEILRFAQNDSETVQNDNDAVQIFSDTVQNDNDAVQIFSDTVQNAAWPFKMTERSEE